MVQAEIEQKKQNTLKSVPVPTTEEINKSIAKVRNKNDEFLNNPEKVINKKDIGNLIFGLNNRDSAESCANALNDITIYAPGIFTKEHVSSIISVVLNSKESDDKESVRECAFALTNLAGNRSEYAEQCISALIAGLNNTASAEGCAIGLGGLTQNKAKSVGTQWIVDTTNKPKYADQCINALLNGLSNQESAGYCADAFKNMLEHNQFYLTEGQTAALLSGLPKGSAVSGPDVILLIAQKKPEYIEQCINALSAGLSNDDSNLAFNYEYTLRDLAENKPEHAEQINEALKKHSQQKK